MSERERKPGEIDQFDDGWGMVMPEIPLTPEQVQELLKDIADKGRQS